MGAPRAASYWLLAICSFASASVGAYACSGGTIDTDPTDAQAETPDTDLPHADGAETGGGTLVRDAKRQNGERDFCFSRPALPLCEDFDEHPLPGAFESMTGESLMQINSDDGTSHPASLVISLEPSASVDARLISRRLDRSRKLRSLVQAKLPARTDSETTELLRLTSMQFDGELDGKPGSFRFSMAIDGSNQVWGEELFEPADQSEPQWTRTKSQLTIPFDQWVSLRLEVDVPVGQIPKFSARIGNDYAFSFDMSTPFGEALAPALSIGLDGAPPAHAWTARFDTITYHYE